LAYEIQCDLTDPFANAGPDQNYQAATVDATLNGSLSNDPDSTITNYTWSCAPGGPIQSGPTIVCTYTHSGTGSQVWTASLTVENECGLTDTDTVNITLTP
jgi:hypothetical protein